ncbi:MAG: hypothetical protein U9N14_01615, partial [Pseudomonadota bacterium]|nr:hypothetical protein [Pseudomonadota bacterium]
MSVLFRALNRMAHNQTDKKAAAASFVRLAPQSTHGKKHLKLLKGRRSALIGFGLALWFAIILVASLYIIDLMGFGGVLVDDPLNAPSSQIADQPSALFEEANAIHIDPATTEESEPVLALIDASEDSMLPATPTEANVGAADLLREIVAADPRYGEAAEQLDEILSGMDSSAPVESIVAPESAVTPESAQVSEPFGIVVEMVKPSADIETQLQTASKAVSAGRYDIALQIYR